MQTIQDTATVAVEDDLSNGAIYNDLERPNQDIYLDLQYCN